MEVGMKICILIPHLCTVPLSTERTPKLPGVHPRGDGSFSGTFSSPRLLLCAKHKCWWCTEQQWNFSCSPPTVRVDTQPIKLTNKASYKSWLFTPLSSCASVNSWQRGCRVGSVHLHPSTSLFAQGADISLLFEAVSVMGGFPYSESTYTNGCHFMWKRIIENENVFREQSSLSSIHKCPNQVQSSGSQLRTTVVNKLRWACRTILTLRCC